MLDKAIENTVGFSNMLIGMITNSIEQILLTLFATPPECLYGCINRIRETLSRAKSTIFR